MQSPHHCHRQGTTPGQHHEHAICTCGARLRAIRFELRRASRLGCSAHCGPAGWVVCGAGVGDPRLPDRAPPFDAPLCGTGREPNSQRSGHQGQVLPFAPAAARVNHGKTLAHRVSRRSVSRDITGQPPRADLHGRHGPSCAARRRGPRDGALRCGGSELLPDGQPLSFRHAHAPGEPLAADAPRQRRHAQGFNRRHAKAGHLFQGRFKSILVDRDNDLLVLCRTVELNPVRAGIVAAPGIGAGRATAPMGAKRPLCRGSIPQACTATCSHVTPPARPTADARQRGMSRWSPARPIGRC